MHSLISVARCFLFVLIVFPAVDVFAQGSSQPLTSALNADGSMKLGVSGSFDSKGYSLSYGPKGEPRFVSSAEVGPAGCGDNWDTTFKPNGASGAVKTIVSDGAGNLYFGGSFTSVQGVSAAGIAKWDGANWSGLGSGVVGGSVNAIAILGTDIYVGGDFGQAGGSPALNVAKWNGNAWSALGAGLGGGTHDVYAATVFNGEIYFGGNFSISDGSPATGLVRWNGSSFSGAGLNGQVYSLAVGGSNLYVGGFVVLIADPTVGGLLKWDGVFWSGFGLTADTTTVDAIGLNGTDIYVGGLIRRTGSPNTQLAKYNGTAWTSLASSLNGSARTFAFIGTDVYVGGSFERSGGIGIGNGILKYNGTTWSALGSGTELGSHTVSAIYVSGNTFYLGGDFQLAGGVGARNIATLTDGTTWGTPFPGTGVDAQVNAIAVSGTDVYVGGTFITAGSVTANRIAKWNGVTQTWSALGSGISGFNTDNSSISGLGVVGNKVYAGGTFSTIGGISANNIAVWNGTTWAPLGSGLNGRVFAMVTKGDDVYVGGDFTTAGGVAAPRIAKWNGTAWSGLNSSTLPNSVVSMAFMGNDLYVGIPTTTIANAAYFSKYDGINWTSLGADLGDRGVSSVAVIGSDVFVSGGFTTIGSLTVNRVAKWNGSSWSALGNGLPAGGFGISGARLAVDGTDLVAVGDFTVASGGTGDRIARWNGTAWSALGTGLNGIAGTIVAAGGDVLVGGGFTTAGCNSSPYFARWRQTVWTASVNSDWHTVSNWGSGSVPAPNAGITITSADASITSADVIVGDMIFGGGRTITIGAGRTLTVNGKLDLSNGSLTGAGNLVVNGDLNLSTGTISNLGSVVINNGTLRVNSGSISNLGSLVINGKLTLTTGNITGTGPVSITTCLAEAIVGGSVTSFIASPLTRCVNSAGIYRFPVGAGSAYAPISLSNVVGNGNFTVDAKSGAYTDPAAGLNVNRLQRWWQFTNGGITQANLVFNYLDSDIVGLEGAYRVYRISSGVAEHVPGAFDTTANTATVSGVTSFSPWTMAEAPADNVFVGGQVTKPNGRGIAYVPVTITDGMGDTRTVLTNHSGYYKFNNISTPRVWTFSVQRFKRMTFTVSQKVVTVSENLTNVNFVSSQN